MYIFRSELIVSWNLGHAKRFVTIPELLHVDTTVVTPPSDWCNAIVSRPQTSDQKFVYRY